MQRTVELKTKTHQPFPSDLQPEACPPAGAQTRNVLALNSSLSAPTPRLTTPPSPSSLSRSGSSPSCLGVERPSSPARAPAVQAPIQPSGDFRTQVSPGILSKCGSGSAGVRNVAWDPRSQQDGKCCWSQATVEGPQPVSLDAVSCLPTTFHYRGTLPGVNMLCSSQA